MKRKTAAFLAAMLLAGLCACKPRVPQEPSQREDAQNAAFSEETGVSTDAGERSQEQASSSEPEEDAQELQKVEKAAKDLLDAMQSGDKTRIGALTDYNDLLQIQSGASDANLLAILKRMEYDVIGISVTGESATAKVAITNIDMHKVLPAYLKQAMELEYNNALANPPLSAEQLEQEYKKLFDGALNYNSINTVERAADLAFVKQNGVWRAKPDDHFRAAAFGDFWNAGDTVGENARG